MSAQLAEVHVLYETNASDIASMLRTAAASIETEVEDGFSPTRAMVAVQLCENGEIKLYGWGKTDAMDSIALLERGKFDLLYTLAARDDE
jgi:hypothetical protein